MDYLGTNRMVADLRQLISQLGCIRYFRLIFILVDT